ncbi:MAG: hypothetical protein ACKOYC_01265 [Bacteroidota bacterium]
MKQEAPVGFRATGAVARRFHGEIGIPWYINFPPGARVRLASLYISELWMLLVFEY